MEEMRKWEDLSPDCLVLIFNKLCFKEKLTIIPRVCKSWNRVVLGPYCWQTIGILDWCLRREDSNLDHDIDKMLQFLVTRSSGILREIIVGNIRNDLTFSFLVDHSRSLRTLEIPWSNVSDSIMEQVAENLSGVTRINLCYCRNIGARGLAAIGKNCKSLVGLKRNWRSFDMSIANVEVQIKDKQIEEAIAIAATMPKLKHLEMTFNLLNTESVVKIIEGCPELEFLDIRSRLPYVDLDPEWLQKCAPNVTILGPEINDRDRFKVDGWICSSEFQTFVAPSRQRRVLCPWGDTLSILPFR